MDKLSDGTYPGNDAGLDAEGLRRRLARTELERLHQPVKVNQGRRTLPPLLDHVERGAWQRSALRLILRLLAAPRKRRREHLRRIRRRYPKLLRGDRRGELEQLVADLPKPLPDQLGRPAVREAVLDYLFPDRETVRTPPEGLGTDTAFKDALNEAATRAIVAKRDRRSGTYLRPENPAEADRGQADVRRWAAIDRRHLEYAGDQQHRRDPASAAQYHRDLELLSRSLGGEERALLKTLLAVARGEPGTWSPEDVKWARLSVGVVNVAEAARRLGWSEEKARYTWTKIRQVARQAG